MRKIFYENVDMTDFTATVVSCEQEENGLFSILLDATAFFPEEGGQTADKGTLNGIPVLDVQIKNDLIYHYVETEFPVGSTVTGHVDWAQRFDFMQQHSGEHIISGLVHERFGYKNVGFHLSVNEVTLDFDGTLTPEEIALIEQRANEVIWQNLPIEITYPSKDELATLSYRSKIEIAGQVRIVTIPGVDVCACCAPHVSATGAIGMIKITSCQSHRGGVRLTIVCGERALTDYNRKQSSVTAISVALSVKQEAVADAVFKIKEDVRQQQERINRLQAQYLALSLSTLPAPSKQEHAILFVERMDTIALRNTVNELTSRYSGWCAIFSGNEADGWQFIIGSSSMDCNTLAQSLRQELNVRCGGSKAMIQGSVSATKQQIAALLV